MRLLISKVCSDLCSFTQCQRILQRGEHSLLFGPTVSGRYDSLDSKQQVCPRQHINVLCDSWAARLWFLGIPFRDRLRLKLASKVSIPKTQQLTMSYPTRSLPVRVTIPSARLSGGAPRLITHDLESVAQSPSIRQVSLTPTEGENGFVSFPALDEGDLMDDAGESPVEECEVLETPKSTVWSWLARSASVRSTRSQQRQDAAQ